MADTRIPLATPAEVAAWLQINTGKLSKMRSAGTGPTYIKSGREVRYAWLDVHKWCDQNRKSATDPKSEGSES